MARTAHGLLAGAVCVHTVGSFSFCVILLSVICLLSGSLLLMSPACLIMHRPGITRLAQSVQRQHKGWASAGGVVLAVCNFLKTNLHQSDHRLT